MIGIAIEARYDKLEELLRALTGLEEHVERQLEKITEARSAIGSGSVSEVEEDLEEIQNGMNSIYTIILEDNPDTYIATTAYNRYMAEISATINTITATKAQYNTVAQKYNTFLEQFPRNLYLKMFGLEKVELYTSNI